MCTYTSGGVSRAKVIEGAPRESGARDRRLWLAPALWLAPGATVRGRGGGAQCSAAQRTHSFAPSSSFPPLSSEKKDAHQRIASRLESTLVCARATS